MSQENVEVVRQPITVRAHKRRWAHTRRSLEERLALRFPRASALLVRAVQRLPPRSRLRRAAIRRAAQLGFDALARDDINAALALYHPEVELIVPEYAGLDLDPVYHGLEERFRFDRRLIAEWGKLRYDFEEVIDLGDGRVLLLGRLKTSGGPSSGAPGDLEFAEMFTVSAGRVIREQAFLSNAEALEAAGLRE
jgi:ketosteroid isomerase-like protein